MSFVVALGRDVARPTMKTKLTKAITLDEFDRGYFSSTELKEFAQAIGIPSASKLRKDELETAIKTFLLHRRPSGINACARPFGGAWLVSSRSG